MSKTLVAYFSASGETARLAKTLAQAAGGDLYAIVPEQAYTSASTGTTNSVAPASK